MAESRIVVDTSCWPVVLVIPRGEVPDDRYREMFSTFDTLWARKERFLTITDTRHSTQTSARQRQLIAEWMKSKEEQTLTYSLGSIIIISSAIVRGALTAINWIVQPRLASVYVSNTAEAVDQAKSMLLSGGLRTGKVMDLLEGVSQRLGR